MKTVIRITRHPLDADRKLFLKKVFGEDVKIITDDIRYENDPIAKIKNLITKTEKEHGKVVAVEAQAPFPIIMKLVDARHDLGVKLIRANFKRDENGRAIVCGKDDRGRDLLKFSHYEELIKIIFETQILE